MSSEITPVRKAFGPGNPRSTRLVALVAMGRIEVGSDCPLAARGLEPGDHVGERFGHRALILLSVG